VGKGGRKMKKKCVHMYVNAKMMPLETEEWTQGENKGEWWRE
jgi:hypothetical protein